MRRGTLALVALNVVLLAAVAALWLTPQGALRNVRWAPPAPVKPALSAAPALPDWNADIGRYLATLDRPLFSPTRRPPPKPQVDTRPPDTLGDAVLLGVYGRETTGGMIARVNGQVQRTRVGESIGGWTLQEIRPGQVLLARGEETRTLDVKLSSQDTAVAAGGSASAVAAPSAQSNVNQMRDQVRNMNRIRARLGMPPLPEP